jgi:hypothetical protein
LHFFQRHIYGFWETLGAAVPFPKNRNWDIMGGSTTEGETPP